MEKELPKQVQRFSRMGRVFTVKYEKENKKLLAIKLCVDVSPQRATQRLLKTGTGVDIANIGKHSSKRTVELVQDYWKAVAAVVLDRDIWEATRYHPSVWGARPRGMWRTTTICEALQRLPVSHFSE